MKRSALRATVRPGNPSDAIRHHCQSMFASTATRMRVRAYCVVRALLAGMYRHVITLTRFQKDALFAVVSHQP